MVANWKIFKWLLSLQKFQFISNQFSKHNITIIIF